jgi:glycosyltransferase involved in cell wall biosynthesis
MIGQGRDLNTLKRKIKKIGLQKRFVLPGKVEKDQILRFYQEATLFVLPSYHEGFPTVLLEAMSCGLPIVATDVRGIRDILSSGINSIMVPPRAPENLAEAILTIIEDEKLMKTIGENARKTIEEKYTWDTVSKDILRFYELVVGV